MTRVGRYFLGIRRDTLPWVFILFFLGVIALTGLYVLRPAVQPSAVLQLGDGVFTTRMGVITERSIEKPIETDVLTQSQALLLAYEFERIVPVIVERSIVPLDIVWLNNDKRVVHIVMNVSHATDSEFTPVGPARYILELPAGTVQKKAISIGTQATFNERRVGGFQ